MLEVLLLLHWMPGTHPAAAEELLLRLLLTLRLLPLLRVFCGLTPAGLLGWLLSVAAAASGLEHSCRDERDAAV